MQVSPVLHWHDDKEYSKFSLSSCWACRNIQPSGALLFQQVIPVGIELFNQSNFLCSCPTFQLLFSCYCIGCRLCFFYINKFVCVVFFCKAINVHLLMFFRSASYIVCNPDIKHAVGMICQDVNPHISFAPLDPSTTLRMTRKIYMFADHCNRVRVSRQLGHTKPTILRNCGSSFYPCLNW